MLLDTPVCSSRILQTSSLQAGIFLSPFYLIHSLVTVIMNFIVDVSFDLFTSSLKFYFVLGSNSIVVYFIPIF
jgi:hypothetical protein